MKITVPMAFFAAVLSTSCRRASAFVPSAFNSRTIVKTSQVRPVALQRFMSAVVEDTKATTAAANEVEELPTNENDDELLRIRHSSAHVMAMAVQQVYPEAQVTIGPWIENGFYYDFYFPETTDPETGDTIPSRKLTDQDLKPVKKAMDKIISKNYPITREEVSREEAERRIKEIGEPFKLEILESIKTEPITIYHIGDEWWDLCAGPHVESTGKIPKKAVALRNVAGAYWRGDESREMLQRIYATAWKNPKQLKAYKKMLEEAKKRDHRVLGQKLDLFSIQVGGLQIAMLFAVVCSRLLIDCRRMQAAGLCFGTPRDLSSASKSKTFGKIRTWMEDMSLFTLPTLPTSTYGKHLGISISTRKICSIKWRLKTNRTRSSR